VRDEAAARGIDAEIEVDLGGGIRDEAAVAAWLDSGLHHVILGTAAVERPELVSVCASRYPGRVWVGIDARGGKVSVAGWTQDTDVTVDALAREVQDRGAAGIVYTDIDRDGTGLGVNVESTRRLAESVNIPVYASGGVRTIADVTALRAVEHAGVCGVIVGRALYDGAVTLEALLAAAED
jgi:phosphoribosylformimino-5-aminoimidazole carboxamide ribotide isomerase